MNHRKKLLSTCLLATAALLVGASPAWAQLSLGAASDFSVLGGTDVTCTDGVIIGDVGVSPGTAFTNTRCTITGGTPPATRAAATRAQTALTTAYNAIQNGACTVLTLENTGDIAGRNLSTLAGVTLAPGTYCIDDVAKTGLLTLNGPSNGIWIFKTVQTAAGDLTGTNFTVSMAGGGQACNVFWAPATAVTMTTSALKGNILAGNATVGTITLTGGSLAGSALAKVAMTITGTSVTGCDVLSEEMSCKPKKHRKHKKNKGHDDDDDDDGGKKNKKGKKGHDDDDDDDGGKKRK